VAFAVSVKLTAKDGAEQEVEGALRTMIPLSRGEAGCRIYEVHRAPDEPRLFYLYEQYDDEPAYQAHRSTDHYTRYIRGEVLERLDDRQVEMYETLA
jgi:quinol monooxygenase YgiN